MLSTATFVISVDEVDANQLRQSQRVENIGERDVDGRRRGTRTVHITAHDEVVGRVRVERRDDIAQLVDELGDRSLPLRSVDVKHSL